MRASGLTSSTARTTREPDEFGLGVLLRPKTPALSPMGTTVLGGYRIL